VIKMPVLAGLVGVAASFLGVTSVIGTFVVGVVVGAVVGAAVGAVAAAITGGDIGKGALWGAVGGAVAGGFSGYAAATSSAANTINASNVAAQSATTDAMFAAPATAAPEGIGAGFMDMSTGTGMLGAGAVQAVGQAVSGSASGEAAGKVNEDSIAAAKEAADTKFAQDMDSLQKQHDLRMKELTGTTSAQVELANLNNTSALEAQRQRLAAEKAAVDAANTRTDEQKAAYNESIVGVSPELFKRPVFEFNPAVDITSGLLEDRV
jgi:hypothetical protein